MIFVFNNLWFRWIGFNSICSKILVMQSIFAAYHIMIKLAINTTNNRMKRIDIICSKNADNKINDIMLQSQIQRILWAYLHLVRVMEYINNKNLNQYIIYVMQTVIICVDVLMVHLCIYKWMKNNMHSMRMGYPLHPLSNQYYLCDILIRYDIISPRNDMNWM